MKDRDALLKRASEEELSLSDVIASDYAKTFELTEEDGVKLVEDMTACAAEYRMEVSKAETLLPEEYLQEKIDAVKADESASLYQKYCVLSGIFEILTSANHAAAEGCGIEEAVEQAKQTVTLKSENEVTEADLDSLAELILSSGSICLLAVPEEYRTVVTDAIDADAGSKASGFDKTDLALLDAYCVYKGIKTGILTPEPEWKDADSLVLLRALVFRATAEQDVEAIVHEVADGKMTWEKAEELLQRICSVLLFGLTISVMLLAAAGSAAAFISLSSVMNVGVVLLLFGSLVGVMYGLYRGFDHVEEWMTEVAAPALASAGIRTAKKANELAKEGRLAFESWSGNLKAKIEAAKAERAAKQAAKEAAEESVTADADTVTEAVKADAGMAEESKTAEADTPSASDSAPVTDDTDCVEADFA